MKGEEIPLLARVLNMAEAFQIQIRGG
ncbi:MAG TPA: hypothetical protein VIN01_06725 [Candidatus Dormibacteraeota bacterium]